MKLNMLIDQNGEPIPKFDYIKEAAERLEKMLGSSLTKEEAIALVEVLKHHSFLFGDGFVINDRHDFAKAIFTQDATTIAASLCKEPDMNRDSLGFMHHHYKMETQEYQALHNEMLLRILKEPSVQLVDLEDKSPAARDTVLNVEKIRHLSQEPDPHFFYLLEIAKRLEKVLGNRLTLAESIALMNVLEAESFFYDDGFIINDDFDTDKMLLPSDRSAIAASLCGEVDRDWEWFKVEYPAYNKESDEYQAVSDDVLARILRDPSIHLREIGEA